MASGEQGPQTLHERILFGALTALFSLLGVFLVPFFYIAPVPLGVITFRQGMGVGTVIALISAVVTGLFIGDPLALVTVILLLALGLALGGGLREGLRPVQLLIVGSVVSTIVLGTFFYTLLNLLGFASIGELFDLLQELMGEQLAGQIAMLRVVYPAALISGAVFYTFFNMWGIQRVLRALKIDTPWFPPLRTWRLPAPWAIAFLVILALGFAPLPAFLHAVLLNVVYGLAQVFIVTGIAVAAFYVFKWGWHPALTVGFALFAFLVPFGNLLAAFLGLLDTGVNLRRHDED